MHTTGQLATTQLPAAGPTEIPEQLNRLIENLTKIEEAVELLDKRLSPILGPDYPSQPAGYGAPVFAGITPMGAKLNEANERLGWQNTKVRQLIDRLGL